MAGRPKIPLGAKILRGTFQPCRDNPDRPISEPIVGIPEPPRELKGFAKSEWDQIIGYIVKNRIVGTEGLSIVATYCNLRGYIIGMEVQGLIAQVPPTMIAQARMLADSLGLTGSGREKLHKPKETHNLANTWESLVKP
jgi:hypothetical protein